MLAFSKEVLRRFNVYGWFVELSFNRNSERIGVLDSVIVSGGGGGNDTTEVSTATESQNDVSPRGESGTAGGGEL